MEELYGYINELWIIIAYKSVQMLFWNCVYRAHVAAVCIACVSYMGCVDKNSALMLSWCEAEYIIFLSVHTFDLMEVTVLMVRIRQCSPTKYE